MRSLAGILGIFLSLYLAARFAPSVAEVVGVDVATRTGYGIAFLIIFILGAVAARIVGNVLGTLVSLSPFGIVDKIGGAVVQSAKAVVLIAAVAVALALLPLGGLTASLLNSRVVSGTVFVTGAIARGIQPHVPGSMSWLIDEAYRSVDRVPDAGDPVPHAPSLPDDYDAI